MSESTPENDGLDDLDFTMDEPVDLTPLLLRQFAWDVMDHDDLDAVNALLVKLGLPPSQPGEDGEDEDHDQSDYRMSFTLPLEILLHAYSSVLGTVLSTAMIQAKAKGMTVDQEAATLYAAQTAEVCLASSRAAIGHLISQGILTYGPGIVGMSAVGVLDDDDE